MLIATEESFDGGPLSWYRDPTNTDLPHYRDSEAFANRAGQIQGKYGGGTVLVAGCGYGFLVKHLINLGVNAWGCDASPWCVAQAEGVAPGRVLQADITSSAQLATVRTAAGLKGKNRFTGTVTEDVLTCLTDAEIAQALTELRGVSSALFHIVTAVEQDAVRDPRFNWKTLEAWKVVVGPEQVMGLETGTVL